MTAIFHITTAADWDAARAAGSYAPPSLRTEGFIHFSSAEQVTRVADARFRGTPDLVLLRVAPDRLTAPLRYETAVDVDERFPHLYGPLDLEAVVDVLPFPEGSDGFALPSQALRRLS